VDASIDAGLTANSGEGIAIRVENIRHSQRATLEETRIMGIRTVSVRRVPGQDEAFVVAVLDAHERKIIATSGVLSTVNARMVLMECHGCTRTAADERLWDAVDIA
jgi:hypothetical protein